MNEVELQEPTYLSKTIYSIHVVSHLYINTGKIFYASVHTQKSTKACMRLINIKLRIIVPLWGGQIRISKRVHKGL